MGKLFKLSSKFAPSGDQPQAIDALCQSVRSGAKYSTLVGVTGSGKTFTMANVIDRLADNFAQQNTFGATLFRV